MIVLCGKITFSEYFRCFTSKSLMGEILLVTSKGIYFHLEGRIFLLTDATIGTTPIGIEIDQMDFSTFLNLTKGQPIYYKDNTLHLPACRIRLEIYDHYGHPEILALQPEQILTCARLLQKHPNPRGVSSLCSRLLGFEHVSNGYTNTLCQAAHPLLTTLIHGLEECDGNKTDAAVKHLIGMGIGLTPSLDDVMLGLLYGLQRLTLGSKSIDLLKRAVLHHAPGNTNDISAAYLQAVANNAPFQRLDVILLSLAGQVPLDIQPLLSIGSSSGSEMLLGLLLAAQIANKNPL